MEFGVFLLAQQRGYHQTSKEVIHNSIEQTVAAEKAGFDVAWYAEHHFNNYSLSPSPLMAIAHCAAKTCQRQFKSDPLEVRGRLEGITSQEGKDLDDDVKFGFLRCGFASDKKSEIDAYLDNARFQRRISESLQHRRDQSEDGYMIKEVPSDNDLSFEQLRKNLPVGSVNEVIDKLLEEVSILKPKHFALQTQLGDCDQNMMLKQIDLWGEKIIPAVRKELERNSLSTVV